MIMSSKEPVWGFKFEDIRLGIVLLLIGGSIALAMWQTGLTSYLFSLPRGTFGRVARFGAFAPGAIAIYGLYKLMNGLIGKEGVW